MKRASCFGMPLNNILLTPVISTIHKIYKKTRLVNTVNTYQTCNKLADTDKVADITLNFSIYTSDVLCLYLAFNYMFLYENPLLLNTPYLDRDHSELVK